MLGDRVEAHEGFAEAWASDARPEACRWLLRPPDELVPAPAGLERPHWPTVGALARGLGMTPAGLWRLTLPPDWQRRRPLARQHYRPQLCPKRGEAVGWRLLELPALHLRGRVAWAAQLNAAKAAKLSKLLDRIDWAR